MGYIGQTPTAVPLVAGDISDGIISEAKLAADAVSLAKMKAGTDGNIITYDASGNPAAVATGSSGQVLTSAGAGAPPTFSAAPAHTGNVAFPATQSASGDANTLDDYEEGDWTPVYAQGTNLGTTSGAGKYTKIGDLVYCTFQATCSNLNSMSGSCKINGIPFTSANNGTYPAGAIGYMSSLDTSAGYSIHFFMNPNTAFLELYLNDVSTGTSGLQASELSTGGQMFGSISFKV